jgi:transposase
MLLYQPSEIMTLWAIAAGLNVIPCPDDIDSGGGMSAPIDLREDFEAGTLRRLAAAVRDAGQARRLLALAAVYDGMSREDAARIGGMDRQTLRDWVHRFNRHGVDGLIDGQSPGRPSKLSAEQKEELRQLVEAGPDLDKDGVVRWRCVDLKRVLGERFGVDLSEVSLGRILKQLNFSRISARPRHRAQDEQAIPTFKKRLSGARRRDGEQARTGNPDRGMVPR